ncbi:hypothetical protein ASPZODRAFT_153809 [Penicilliopsis zonata CBS 506.65]|uniref:Uncharacterized protein n=1 Tax=Penicilliopsis zonata CBS 506.65 TaxID=1073090 RepID=A0A1L9SB63_9EURO|nr:hypothetical protein ASPZODRAFT_153809 [Penicilliopsis zonata CBS 506.65]OJJ44349.1 hypothetical protein ASPZODRAFT_153809 [Penicilliopsis zonata CBS 506.65]
MDFSNPSFDPADFLNENLPPLTLASTQPHASRAPGAVPLAELSTQIQSLLAQINAQNVRLSNNLTQLTDEILRSGSRLAYEVEVLRGETIGLSDTLAEALHADIERFVPGHHGSIESKEDSSEDTAKEDTTREESTKEESTESTSSIHDPDFIVKVRTLNQVRARLEEVVHTFGEAMEWPLPPSEMSLASSFISVSAPEPVVGADGSHNTLEEKGQAKLQAFHDEITALLDAHGHGHGHADAAARRIEALRVLATVWKGTAEEKARTRFLDGLARLVDDRRKALEKERNQAARDRDASLRESTTLRGSNSARGRSSMDQSREGESTTSGLLRNLQRLRDEIYLE